MNVPSLFGSMVFNDTVMKAHLPKDTYKALKKAIATNSHLELDVANVVANAMKDWAVEKGVTHFTHWFQPMTGVTAEKHDSFISPTPDGKVIMEFSGKELVRGEPDASSFPNGGLRATFEARGYTAWDPTSYAFIKDDSLCIPTAFCSYNGEALDKKTPLLKSMQAVNKQALRILRLFGDTETANVRSDVGPEQEYFLIDRDMFLKRQDLVNCGRTLFGAKPAKGQELEDHYFGTIKRRVSDYMKELDEELWKLGVLAKTKHNEVAPAQHELAPIYSTTNIATDHNQLTMELMKSIAGKHNLACLLHEKPFAGINGSGKHNNWSMSTDTGKNLLSPGDTPYENAQFLLFLVAVIKAVNKYQDLLRLSVASAGNDHRLGANEAPPAIVSIFLGEELTDVLYALENDSEYVGKEKIQMEIGATVLPHFPKDTTDRNRTSPFAFTGNKFEFRMLGSAFSISGPNIILNTIVAEILDEFADVLEPAKDFKTELSKLIKDTIKENSRIIFNGNNYSEEWAIEAEKRGLLNLKTTPEALPVFIEKKNVDLFIKHNVFTLEEIYSRYEILLDDYIKIINIEALTMIDMINKHVIPSVIKYQTKLSKLIAAKQGLGSKLSCRLEESILEKTSGLSEELYAKLEVVKAALKSAGKLEESQEKATAYRKDVFENMNDLRDVVDQLEEITSKECWSLPTYTEILYSV